MFPTKTILFSVRCVRNNVYDPQNENKSKAQQNGSK